ncbi:hypothetical protein GE061_011719 [Apolygus lucorum]|uniref:Uncharacterized protein n=1 Tax=Apolygus lucorum TaxID=248454 RepID=A0A8S9XY57_APOLU|nr:hypothetical protein GE061_011719 [Apolygus lucorum]
MKSMKEQKRHALSPIENPYVINEFGYVSQESAGFYEKFMNKYCNVKPEGYYLGPPSTKEMRELKEKKKPSKTKTPGRRKKVKSKEIISDDDDDDENGDRSFKAVESSDNDDKAKVPKIKILLPVKRPENDKENEKPDDGKDPKKKGLQTKLRKGGEVTNCWPPKRKYVPAPLNFDELLKLAEKKQHEPVLLPGSEFDSKRPMTQKEKALHLLKLERIKKRKLDKESQKEPPTTALLPAN